MNNSVNIKKMKDKKLDEDVFICAVLRRGEYRRQERIVFELRGRKRAWWSASAGTSLRPVVQDGVTAAEAPPVTNDQSDVAMKMGGK